MKTVLAVTVGLAASGISAQAEEINVMSWRGAVVAAQMEAYHKPYMAETGIKINSIDADNPAVPIKAQSRSAT